MLHMLFIDSPSRQGVLHQRHIRGFFLHNCLASIYKLRLMSQHQRKSALAKFVPSRWLQSQFYKSWLKRCWILVSPGSPLSSRVWERLHISITWTCKEVCRMCSSHWWDCWDHESVGLFCPTWKIAWDLAVHLGSNCWVSLTCQAHPVSAVSSISSLSRASRGAASKRDRHAIFQKRRANSKFRRSCQDP